MNAAVLHVLDPTTPADALEMLATLVNADASGDHQVVVMGHLATKARAIAAGVPAECIEHVHSAGAFDPTGWRGLGKIVRRDITLYLHAWGFRGIVAGTAVRASNLQRIATFTLEPSAREQKWLGRVIKCAPWLWLATSERIARKLRQIGPSGKSPLAGLLASRCGHAAKTEIRQVNLGIGSEDVPARKADTLRKELGIRPGDGPIVLLGGEMTEPAARQTYGLWAGAILQKIFPAMRILIHTGTPQPMSLRQDILNIRQLAATAPDPNFIIYCSPDVPWLDLLQVADIMVATPDKPMSINSILWAMGARVPIVATATPQMEALIEDGRTGLLAEVNKPRSIAARLEELLSNPDLGIRLATAAHKHVLDNFAAERMVEQLRGIYAHALENVTAA